MGDRGRRGVSGRRWYIVTGGAGFVGSNLVAELARRDPEARLTVIDPMRSGSFANLVEAFDRAGVGPFRGEVFADSAHELDWAGIQADRPPAAVFHLGAITDTTVADEREMLAGNVSGFRDMLEACAELGCPLVYASSAATYGSPAPGREGEPFAERDAGRPNNVYGFSKWMMDVEADRYQAERAEASHPPAWVVGLRYFNVFGPGESRKGSMASMAYQLAQQLLSGQRPRLFEFGEQRRDFVHVGDVVDATLAAAGIGGRSDPVPGVYNVGSGRASSFNEILAAVREGVGVTEAERPTEYIPMPERIRAFYQGFTLADLSRATSAIGWSPARDPLEETLAYAASLREQAAGVGSA